MALNSTDEKAGYQNAKLLIKYHVLGYVLVLPLHPYYSEPVRQMYKTGLVLLNFYLRKLTLEKSVKTKGL